jgi:aminoglycoside phosphotransferase (APT) family kinase protein
MSSETLMFDATWDDPDVPGGRSGGSFVVRLEPAADAVPVFPTYDLESQHRVMRLVAEHSAAPVPRVRWLETDRSVLGGAFFVMDRVEGRVPPDVMPYPIEGFVLELTDEERRHLQDTTVDALVEIHRVPLGEHTDFLQYEEPGDTALRRHVNHWRALHDWVRGDRAIPVLDDALAWLKANWPVAADERDPVVSWGDSRIGNVMYGPDNAPIAVLDWEMAGIAPREVDLGWMAFLHTFFQDIAAMLEVPGLPDMLRLDDLAHHYAARSGVEPLDLAWFEVYAAYRHGVVMVRVRDRQEHFGEAEPVSELDELVMHRDRLRQLIAG